MLSVPRLFVISLFLLLFVSTALVNDALAFKEKINAHQLKINKAQLVQINMLDESNHSDEDEPLNLRLELEGRSIQLLLNKNESLVASDSQLLAQHNVQVYKGQIEDLPSSWVRITFIDNMPRGIIFDGESVLLLQPFDEAAQDFTQKLSERIDAQNLIGSRSSVVFNLDDVEHNAMCALHGSEDLDLNDLLDLDLLTNDTSDSDRDPLAPQTASRTISVSMFADTEFAQQSTNAIADMLAHLNFADGVFSAQLDIQLKLGEAVALNDNGSLTATKALDLLQAFRATDLANPGIRHLFTGKEIDGGTVGLAYVGRLCTETAAGLTQRFGALTDIIFAHELGHNFGAPHDNQANSACESSPSGFIMNPSVNGGGPNFSACSVSQMLPVIDRFQGRYDWCITEQSIPTVTIQSSPSTKAVVGRTYRYDSDNIINVRGNAPFSYSLDIGPDGMSISNNGLVEWTPTDSDVGDVFVQITVSNDVASDTQDFTVQVSEASAQGTIDFSQYEILSYAGSKQDKSGGATTSDDGAELSLEGNTWKKILLNYTVTQSTVLEFEFESSHEGELHGIGFDTNDSLSESYMFTIFGTDDWGVNAYRYTAGSGRVTMVIPVGFHFQGDFTRLIFMNDNDKNLDGVNSKFSNVRLYESDNAVEPSSTIDFNQTNPIDYLPGQQDMRGTATVIESGAGIELIGNKWQTIDFPELSIGKNTFMEFEFKSDSRGEIHGIGFFEGSRYTSKRMFMLHGTQRWGVRSFKYSGDGEYQRFIIPLGKYFTSDTASMIFMNDHDVSEGNANSSFRNIKFY